MFVPIFARLPLGCALLLLASCAVGVDYQPPQETLEATFKNTGLGPPPPAGSWWSLFDDPELSRLIRKAEGASPTAQAALARYDQARAALGLARADAFPLVTGDAYARRQADSPNTHFSSGTYEDYKAALNLSWEIDLWGRVRRQIGAARADLEASAYDLEAALLSLRGEIARAYFGLRSADAEIALLEQTTALRAEAERLMKSRFEKGANSRIDYERAVTEHASVVADLDQVRAQRGRFENALAAMTGESAAGFQIGADGRALAIPAVPGSVPSDLLRRRPDIAAAERRLAAASERIGLAIASYLPRLTLTGEGGVQSLQASDLFNSGSTLWSIGPEVSVPLFQGGRAFGDKARAEAGYREALALYRDTLLNAVRDTEDSLGDARDLAQAASARERGSESAAAAAQLTRKRYSGGITDYFEVVDAERTALAEQRSLLHINLARSLAATRLIEALGGGWTRE